MYVFTGQGSQEPGMGMELYNNSPMLQLAGRLVRL
jgi:malonyl CoA-acyl carrier protein transacylase